MGLQAFSTESCRVSFAAYKDVLLAHTKKPRTLHGRANLAAVSLILRDFNDMEIKTIHNDRLAKGVAKAEEDHSCVPFDPRILPSSGR